MDLLGVHAVCAADVETGRWLFWLGLSVAVAISLALASFAANKLRRRDWLPLFLLGWFLVVISPILPLRDHFTEYYVVVPSIGLAILGAWALASARGRTAVVADVLRKAATVRIAGPKAPGQSLEVTGYCPAVVLSQGPLQVSFHGDGIAIGSVSLNRPNQHFDLKLPLPSALIGRPGIEVEVEVNHTIRRSASGNDPRTLGLVLQTFTIK